MAEPRTYTVGLPVTITVHSDRTVTYTVHIEDCEEAITETLEWPDEDRLYTDDQVVSDAAVAGADAEAYGTDRECTPQPAAQPTGWPALHDRLHQPTTEGSVS